MSRIDDGKTAYCLTELFGEDWAGLATDGATRVRVKAAQLERAERAGISEDQLTRLGLVTAQRDTSALGEMANPSGTLYWEFKMIMERAAAYERAHPAKSAASVASDGTIASANQHIERQ